VVRERTDGRAAFSSPIWGPRNVYDRWMPIRENRMKAYRFVQIKDELVMHRVLYQVA